MGDTPGSLYWWLEHEKGITREDIDKMPQSQFAALIREWATRNRKEGD